MSFDREFSDMPLLGLQGTRKRKQVQRDGMVNLSSWGNMSVTQIQMQFQAFENRRFKSDVVSTKKPTNAYNCASTTTDRNHQQYNKGAILKKPFPDSVASHNASMDLVTSPAVNGNGPISSNTRRLKEHRSSKFTGLVERPNCPQELQTVIATRSPADNSSLDMLVGRIISKHWRKYGYYLGVCDHVNEDDGTMFVKFEDGDSDSLFLDEVLAMLMPTDALPICTPSAQNAYKFTWPPEAHISKHAVERERTRILAIVARRGDAAAGTVGQFACGASSSPPAKKSSACEQSASATPTSPPRTTQDLAAMAQHLMSRASQSPGCRAGGSQSPGCKAGDSPEASPVKPCGETTKNVRSSSAHEAANGHIRNSTSNVSHTRRHSTEAVAPGASPQTSAPCAACTVGAHSAHTCGRQRLPKVNRKTTRHAEGSKHSQAVLQAGSTSVPDACPLGIHVKSEPGRSNIRSVPLSRSASEKLTPIRKDRSVSQEKPPTATMSRLEVAAGTSIHKACRVVWTLLDSNYASKQECAWEMSSMVFDYE